MSNNRKSTTRTVGCSNKMMSDNESLYNENFFVYTFHASFLVIGVLSLVPIW